MRDGSQESTTDTSHAEHLASACGTFEVTLAPLPPYNDSPEARLGRRSIDKQFQGDLQGSSRGEMLSAGTAVPDSMAYTAIERVHATLLGRRGAFTLQHAGMMTGGTQTLTITVVPDSGTDELRGISGVMRIKNVGGQHRYEFDFRVPPVTGDP